MPSIQSLQPERLDSEDTETAGDEDGDEDEDADGTGLDSKETAFSGDGDADGDADGDENEPEPPAIDGETTSTRVAELHSLFASLGTILQLEADMLQYRNKGRSINTRSKFE